MLNYLLHKILNIRFFRESMIFELQIRSKECNFLSLYRSPNQSKDKFDKFIEKLELTFDTLYKNNYFLVVVLGDFNVKCKNWYRIDKTINKGYNIQVLESQSGLP